MFSKLHSRLGTAGLVVAIVALVAALAGTAFAATALNGTQKKEVEKIAKKLAGKQGPKGATGATGATGANGKDGAPGAAGTNGVSPVGSAFAGFKEGCTEGGVEIKGANTTVVCNGKKGEKGAKGETGSPWPAGGTLPTGATETGAWAFHGTTADTNGALAPISFAIPLASPLDEAHTLFLPVAYNGEDGIGAEHEKCPGTEVNPRAKTGFLCVYTSSFSSATFQAILQLDAATPGASKPGAVMAFAITANGALGFGSYAVTG